MRSETPDRTAPAPCGAANPDRPFRVSDPRLTRRISAGLGAVLLALAAGLPPTGGAQAETDPPLLWITEESADVRLTEISSDKYVVRLGKRPTADVTVTIANSDSTVAKVEPSSLTFSPSDPLYKWVEVTGVDDGNYTPGGVRTITLTHTTESSDSEFNGLTATVTPKIFEPTRPSDVRAHGRDDAIRIQWSPSVGYPTYYLHVRTQADSTWVMRGTTNGSIVQWTNPGRGKKYIENGTRYEIRVCNGDGPANGPQCSESVFVTPTASPPPFSVGVTVGVKVETKRWRGRWMEVRWLPSDTPDATQFRVRWRTEGAGSWEESADLPRKAGGGLQSFTIDTTASEATYEIAVAALYDDDGAITKKWSEAVSVKSVGEAPAIVSLHATADNRIEAVWQRAAGAMAHKAVYAKASGTLPPVHSFSSPNADFMVTKPLEAGEYKVAVYAFFRAEGTYFRLLLSPVRKITLGGTPPSNVRVVSGHEKLTVSWDRLTNGKEFKVADWPVDGALDMSPAPANSETSHEITGLTNGTTYQVQVQAKVDGATYKSGVVTATVGGSPPTKVGVVRGDGKLTVSWNNAPGAASHSVRHKLSSDADEPANWTTATPASKPYKITGLTNGTEYDVQVGAVHDTGSNPKPIWSPTVKGTPAAGASGMMGPPRGVVVDPGDGAVGMT